MADFGISESVLAYVAIAATVASAAVSAYGAIESSEASAASARYNAEAANYQAQVAANDQTIANNNASYAVAAGAQQANQQALSTRALLGNEEAVQGSSGLDINSGSAEDVRAGTAALGNLSEMNIVNNAAREAYGFQVQGINYQAQSQLFTGQSGLDTLQSEYSLQAGATAAFGDVIGGVGKAGSLGVSLSNSGAFQTASVPDLTGSGDSPNTVSQAF